MLHTLAQVRVLLLVAFTLAAALGTQTGGLGSGEADSAAGLDCSQIYLGESNELNDGLRYADFHRGLLIVFYPETAITEDVFLNIWVDLDANGTFEEGDWVLRNKTTVLLSYGEHGTIVRTEERPAGHEIAIRLAIGNFVEDGTNPVVQCGEMEHHLVTAQWLGGAWLSDEAPGEQVAKPDPGKNPQP